jgi:hypothetical protein
VCGYDLYALIFCYNRLPYNELPRKTNYHTFSCSTGSQRKTPESDKKQSGSAERSIIQTFTKRYGCKEAVKCYNWPTMSTAIDISTIPALARLVEEVETTKKPRELIRENKVVAVLSPVVADNTEKWKHIKATFGSWKDIDAHELIATIYRWRAEGTRPATRPE